MTFGPKRECAQPLPSLLKLLETLRSVDRYTPAPQISPEVIRSVPEKFRRPLHKAAPAVACCAVHVAHVCCMLRGARCMLRGTLAYVAVLLTAADRSAD